MRATGNERAEANRFIVHDNGDIRRTCDTTDTLVHGRSFLRRAFAGGKVGEFFWRRRRCSRRMGLIPGKVRVGVGGMDLRTGLAPYVCVIFNGGELFRIFVWWVDGCWVVRGLM